MEHNESLGDTMVKFDPRLKECRSPQGAVPTGSAIKIRLSVSRNQMCKSELILSRRINHNISEIARYPMCWTEAHQNWDIYETVFAINETGHYTYSFGGVPVCCGEFQILVYSESQCHPLWLEGGTIYHIFVDRFYKEKTLSKEGKIIIHENWGETPLYTPDAKGEILNNDFFGGNLDGITAKLSYIKSLGATAIYLSPIFEAYSNHKYDTGDYMKVDPMFGDEAALRRLCCKAYEEGISIILDGVFSHTGADSVYFNIYKSYDSIGAYENTESPYRDWYIFNSSETGYACWWGIKTLPAANKECKSYIDFITGEHGVIAHWMEAGIRGWRLDVADELPDRFLKNINHAVKNCKEDAAIIGEVWEDAANKYAYGVLKEYFCGHELDSVTNYPLREALIHYVKTSDSKILKETVGFIQEKYPPHTINCLMNILGTHDTVRILTELGRAKEPTTKDEASVSRLSDEELKIGVRRLKTASFLQFTLPGVPCIYYGDEAGLEGWKDPFNRRCYPWDNENMELLNHYRAMAAMRKSFSVLRDGEYKCLISDGGVFAFERFTDSEKIIACVNMTQTVITLLTAVPYKDYITGAVNTEFNVKSEGFMLLSRN